MKFTDSVDEIVALIMAVAGVAVLLGGLYATCVIMCELAIEDLLLVSGALLGPSSAYLFGKSVPKKEDNDIKDILMQNMHK
jgi:uncharacterized membrane protein YiaA